MTSDPTVALASVFLREAFKTVGDDLRGLWPDTTDEQVNLLHIDWIEGKPLADSALVKRAVDAFEAYPRIFGTPRRSG